MRDPVGDCRLSGEPTIQIKGPANIPLILVMNHSRCSSQAKNPKRQGQCSLPGFDGVPDACTDRRAMLPPRACMEQQIHQATDRISIQASFYMTVSICAHHTFQGSSALNSVNHQEKSVAGACTTRRSGRLTRLLRKSGQNKSLFADASHWKDPAVSSMLSCVSAESRSKGSPIINQSKYA